MGRDSGAEMSSWGETDKKYVYDTVMSILNDSLNDKDRRTAPDQLLFKDINLLIGIDAWIVIICCTPNGQTVAL